MTDNQSPVMTDDQNSVSEENIFEQNSQTDFYQILGIERYANLAIIKEKYLQLALLYHPDKPTGDLKKFKDVCLAYKVLSSNKRRKEYDATLAATYDELRQVERDTKYHQNPEYLKTDGEGNQVFDQEKFQSEFLAHREGHDEFKKMEAELRKREKENRKREELFKGDTLDALVAERNRELDNITAATPVMDPNNFDASIFNQMFNTLKEKSTALAEVHDPETEEPESAFSGMDLNFHPDQGQTFADTDSFAYHKMFGSDRSHHVEQQTMQEIRERASEYKPDESLMCVRDQMEGEQQKTEYYDKVECQMQDMRKDFERNLFLDKSEYIVKPEMLNNPLGDSELFQEKILGIEAIKREVVNELTDDELLDCPLG